MQLIQGVSQSNNCRPKSEVKVSDKSLFFNFQICFWNWTANYIKCNSGYMYVSSISSLHRDRFVYTSSYNFIVSAEIKFCFHIACPFWSDQYCHHRKNKLGKKTQNLGVYLPWVFIAFFWAAWLCSVSPRGGNRQLWGCTATFLCAPFPRANVSRVALIWDVLLLSDITRSFCIALPAIIISDSDLLLSKY